MRKIQMLASAAALVALALLAGTAAPAEAQGCPPFLCYVDLAQGTFICPNTTVYPPPRIDPVVTTAFNPTCDVAGWNAAVVQVNVPEGCSGVSVWVEYAGEPEGWTLNVGDSLTNDGFGGDASSLPAGQNAELQILDDTLTVYGAIPAPPNDTLVTQTVALRDGGLRVNVEDQFVSWGGPYSELMTPDYGRLFFLPEDPAEGENRTVYVGLNRTISPIGGQNATRNGCGLRRALLTIR